MKDLDDFKTHQKENIAKEMAQINAKDHFMLDPSFHVNYINFLFRLLSGDINKLESDQITKEELDECIKNLYSIQYDLGQLVSKCSCKVLPNQFNLIIHTICLLSYLKIKDILQYNYINIACTLIQNYPELVETFLVSQEVQNYVNTFKDLFMGWEFSLLTSFLNNSQNAAPVFISNGILTNIFNTMQGTIPLVLTYNQNPERDAFIDYWICAVSSLQNIAVIYYADQSVIKSIFCFLVQFLSIDFYNLREGFFFKVIDCISVTFLHFDNFNQINFEQHLPLFKKLLFENEMRGRIIILKLFNIISKPPINFQFDQPTIIDIAKNIKIWLNSKYSGNEDYFNIISLSFDFMSNIISYHPNIFDALNELAFFDLIFTKFMVESHKLKIHIVNFFLSLTIPQIWPKSINFFANNQILTEILLFIDSGIDEELRLKIIHCLIQICSTNISSYPLNTQELIIKELQSDIVSSVLSNLLENEDNNELITCLINQIHSFTANQ